jgi:hypothetical protein
MRLTVLTVLAALAIATTAAGTAEAVVCKTAGVPKGCTAAAPAGNAAGAAAASPVEVSAASAAPERQVAGRAPTGAASVADRAGLLRGAPQAMAG